MKVFKDLQEFINYRKEVGDKTVGFTPTMGALHQGHISLVEASRNQCDVSVVSIYVNPTQFNSAEDLSNYPSSVERDLEMLKQVGCDAVLLPTYQQLYPLNYRYKITEEELSQRLCGTARPGHFDGVLTVVMKLFGIVKPTHTFFGEKDYQQLQLIKDMVASFFLDIQVVPVKTAREENGLAMSSRNRRLNDERRNYASQFSQLLKSNLEIEQMKQALTEKGFEVDYLEEIEGRRYGAVFLDNVRLIDNVSI